MGRCVAGQTKTFGIELGSVANAGKFQVNPTLDAADFRISINGGAFAALTNTPTVTPAGGAQVQVVLAAAETTSAGAGGRIHFRASDSSGAEWQDLAIDLEVFATEEDTLVATVTNLTNAPTNGDLTAAMKTSVTAAVPSAATIATTVWDKLTSALTTVGSIGKLLADNIDAAISSRLAIGSYTAPPTAAQVRAEMDANSTKLDATVSSRATPADVNAQVLDVLVTDTFAEPSAVPAATSTLKDKINWLFALARNKKTQTSSTQTLYADNGSTTVATSTTSDDETTATRGEWS